MKNSGLFSVVVACAVALSTPCHAQVALDEGLVALYPFSRNADDISGNERNLTVAGAIRVADRNGRPAAAYSFDGASSILTAEAEDPELSLNEGATISCWVKITSFNPNGSTLVRKDGNIGFNIFNFQSPNRLSIEVFRDGRQYRGFAGSPPVGQWAMLTATWNGTDFGLFINGVGQVVAQDDLPRDLPVQPITIGGSIPWPEQTFNGVIDDVRIYNRALSQEEITALHLLPQASAKVFTGAWYETKAPAGGVPNAGEIRIQLFDDQSCAAIRQLNDGDFDLGEGTWKPGKKGTKIVSFTSDFAGEVFQGTVKKGVLNGAFSGGGYAGRFVSSPVAGTEGP
jgi:hypothetical protein